MPSTTADTAGTPRSQIHQIGVDDDLLVQLRVLDGVDIELAPDSTRQTNRLCDAPKSVSPAVGTGSRRTPAQPRSPWPCEAPDPNCDAPSRQDPEPVDHHQEIGDGTASAIGSEFAARNELEKAA